MKASSTLSVAVFVMKHLRYQLTDSPGFSDDPSKPRNCGSLGDGSPHVMLILSVSFLEFCVLVLSRRISINLYPVHVLHAPSRILV